MTFIWDGSWENVSYGICEQQRRDPRSLISAIVVRCLDNIISEESIAKISRLYAASVAAQAGLCLAWSETPEYTFCHVVAHIYVHFYWLPELEFLWRLLVLQRLYGGERTLGSIWCCNKVITNDDLLSLFTAKRKIANGSQYPFGVFRLSVLPLATNGMVDKGTKVVKLPNVPLAKLQTYLQLERVYRND